MSLETWKTVLRIVFGVGCFGLAIGLAKSGVERGEFMMVVWSLPAAVAALVALTPPLLHLAARPFTAIIDAVFFPGGKLDKPVLNLKLPAHYINTGRYEEALAEYRKILKHHPDETEAYEQAAWLLATVYGDLPAAERLVRRAKRRHLALDERVVRLAAPGGLGRKRLRPPPPPARGRRDAAGSQEEG